MKNMTPANESSDKTFSLERGCYTTTDIAGILGVGMKAVYHLLKLNEFRVIKLPGGIYRIPRESFDRWLNEKT